MILLSLIAYQDFKDRLVSWYLFPFLLVFLIYKGVQGLLAIELFEMALVNLSFLIIQFVLGTLYVSIKERRLINITKEWIGWGDVLFLVVISVAFSPLNFFVFYLLSLIGITGIAIAQKVMISNPEKLIPLAGLMALFLVVIMAINLAVFSIDLYDDSLLANLILDI